MLLQKFHTLIKQLPNSLLSIMLAQDLLSMQNMMINNISVQFDNNAIFIVTSSLSMYNVTIMNTMNYEYWGPLYILALSTVIDSCLIQNNSSPIGRGGAIYLDYDTIQNSLTAISIVNSFFINNEALDGVFLYFTRKSIIFNCVNNTFIGLDANLAGGAMLTLQNATIQGFNFTNNTITYNVQVPNSVDIFNFLTLEVS